MSLMTGGAGGVALSPKTVAWEGMMMNVMFGNWEGWQQMRLFLSHAGDSLAQGRSEVKL